MVVAKAIGCVENAVNDIEEIAVNDNEEIAVTENEKKAEEQTFRKATLNENVIGTVDVLVLVSENEIANETVGVSLLVLVIAIEIANGMEKGMRMDKSDRVPISGCPNDRDDPLCWYQYWSLSSALLFVAFSF